MIITISDSSKNQSKRLDSDNTIKLDSDPCFGLGQTTVSNFVQFPFHIHGEGHESVFEYQDLFDCGDTVTFGCKSLFVDKLGFKPSGKCVTVKNGDDRSPERTRRKKKF